MTKAIVFDMDGTLCNFYGVDGWMKSLEKEETRPYDVAEPLYNMETLCSVLNCLKMCGWAVVITSWLSKNGSETFNNQVRESKRNWLAKYNFPYDEIHLVKYGTTKADCTRKKYDYQILVDDNESVRKGWHLGTTINANEDILIKLNELLRGDN